MQKRKDPEQLKEDERIRERIKQAILSKGMKLKQFARESGMAYPSLRDYYSGLRKPGFDAIATILKFTGVSAEWLMLGHGNIFTDDETPLANVDELLVGQITKAMEEFVQQELEAEAAAEEEAVADSGEEGEYLYSLSESERRENLHKAGSHGVIVGSVYNRVANIGATKRREEAIKREVRSLMRMNRSLNRLDESLDELPAEE